MDMKDDIADMAEKLQQQRDELGVKMHFKKW